jgi:hypothetical protein
MTERISRREFLRSAGRLGVLGGLALLGARLLRGKPRPGDQACVNDSICRGCPTLVSCGLPQALSAKEAAPWAHPGA